MKNNKDKKWCNTPEDCFVLGDHVDKSKLDDAIHTSLSRALATLNFVQVDGADLDHGFTMNNKSIMDALWSIESQIAQAQTLLSAYSEHKRT